MAQFLNFLWVWPTLTRGGASNLRGGVESDADVTDRRNSKPPVRGAYFLKTEKAKEGEDKPGSYFCT